MSLAAKTAVGRSGRESSSRAGSAGALGAVAADPDQVGVDRHAGGGHGVAETFLAQARRLEVLAASEQRDPAVAQVEQVLGGGHRARDVVGVDRGEAGGAGVRVDRHHRDLGRRRHHGGRDEDGAVDQGAAEPAERPALPPHRATVVAAGVGEQLVPGLVDRARDPLEQLGAERLELGDQHADHVGAVAAQAAGPEARLVAERLDDLGDLVHRALGDAVALVDDLRHRRDGHARRAGDVLHPHAPDGRHGARLPAGRWAPAAARNRCRGRCHRTPAVTRHRSEWVCCVEVHRSSAG